MIWSLRSLLPLQLVSWKVELALPDKVVTGVSSVALLFVVQSELKLMEEGVCTRVTVPSLASNTKLALTPKLPPALILYLPLASAVKVLAN